MVPTSTRLIWVAATEFGSVSPAPGAAAAPNRWALTMAVTSTACAAGAGTAATGPLGAAWPLRAPSSVQASCTSCQASRTTSAAETTQGRVLTHPSDRAPSATEARLLRLFGNCIRARVSVRPARPFAPRTLGVAASYGLGQGGLKVVAQIADG